MRRRRLSTALIPEAHWPSLRRSTSYKWSRWPNAWGQYLATRAVVEIGGFGGAGATSARRWESFAGTTTAPNDGINGIIAGGNMPTNPPGAEPHRPIDGLGLPNRDRQCQGERRSSGALTLRDGAFSAPATAAPTLGGAAAAPATVPPGGWQGDPANGYLPAPPAIPIDGNSNLILFDKNCIRGRDSAFDEHDEP